MSAPPERPDGHQRPSWRERPNRRENPVWRGRVDAVLRAQARRRETIAYIDLALAAEVPAPKTIHKLTETLEHRVRADLAAGRPLLAAIAVRKPPATIPGRGFFMLLTELGLYQGDPDGPEAAACHAQLLGEAFDYWGREESQAECQGK